MRTSLVRAVVAGVLALAVGSPVVAAGVGRKPNIIFILADDLGYGDLGVTGQNARAAAGKAAFGTPHLDQLAASGVVLRNHYTGAPVCAPARASLLTGMSQGACPIRDNQFDKPIPAGLLTIGSVLREAGYRTAVIGKWGLGGKGGAEGWPAHPMERGFDDFFGYMRHGTGHVYYHDAGHPLMEGRTDVGGEYENVYSTDLFTARAKRFIVEQHEKRPGQPFFLYLAYTAVHMVLNVPGGAYPEGAGAKGGLQWPVKPTPGTRDSWIHPDYAGRPWTDPMKRYATMARRLDDGVGDLLQLLKDLGVERDTLVVFTSDNGPEFSSGADPRLFDSWGPFDGFKRDVFEGGVREPTIAAWPGHIAGGVTDDSLTGFWDWMPTFAELAGLPGPAQSDGVSLVPNLLGGDHPRSHPYVYIEYNFKAPLRGPSQDVGARKGAIRGQQQMVRVGDMVGVRTAIKSAGDPIRLYDVKADPHEDHDLAGEAGRAEVVRRMTELMVTARVAEADAPRPYDGAMMPAVEVAGAVPGVRVVVAGGRYPYTPDVASLPPAAASEIVAAVGVPAGRPEGAFAAAFTGYLSVPADGEYRLAAKGDGGVHVWVHEAHVVSSEGGAGRLGAGVHLRAGLHPIRVAYRHGGEGTPELSLRYSGPGVEEREVPAGALFTSP